MNIDVLKAFCTLNCIQYILLGRSSGKYFYGIFNMQQHNIKFLTSSEKKMKFVVCSIVNDNLFSMSINFTQFKFIFYESLIFMNF